MYTCVESAADIYCFFVFCKLLSKYNQYRSLSRYFVSRISYGCRRFSFLIVIRGFVTLIITIFSFVKVGIFIIIR